MIGKLRCMATRLKIDVVLPETCSVAITCILLVHAMLAGAQSLSTIFK